MCIVRYMQNPANLKVSAEAMTLAVLTYRFTQGMPATERYELTAQMRRAAVSVGSNIAEGCGRRGNTALIAALHVALGSVNELAFQARLSAELGMGADESRLVLLKQAERVTRMLARLITVLRRRADRPDA